jgi:valyl-tRNA synthetase
VSGEIDEALEEYRFDEAANAIYQFFWSEFCDWYLELVKLRLNFDEGENIPGFVTLGALIKVFEAALRLLSPFMPFLTEELWDALLEKLDEGRLRSIAEAHYPVKANFPFDIGAEADMALLRELIATVRALRKEIGVPEKEFAAIVVFPRVPSVGELAVANVDMLAKMARVSGVTLSDKPLSGNGVKSTPNFDVQLLYERVIDVAAERERLTRDLAKYEKGLLAAEKQLGNEAFIGRAPAHIVEGLKKQAAETRLLYGKTKAALDALPPE